MMSQRNGVKIAAAQINSVNGFPFENLSNVEKYASTASKQDVQILICPELCLTGYNFDVSDVHKLSIDIDGDSNHNKKYLDEIRKIAIKYNIDIVIGFVELNGGKYYNSVLWMSNKGKIRTIYRKTYLYPGPPNYKSNNANGNEKETSFEKKVFSEYPNKKDSDYKVVECCGYKFGLLICFDIEFPELSRKYALKGCDCILIPTAVCGYQPEIFDLFPRTRALENSLYVAYVNHPGPNYCGSSTICAPDGTKITSAPYKGESLLVATIHPENYDSFYPQIVKSKL